EFVCLSITVVEFLFTTFTGLFHKKCDRLKARVVIYAYNHHVRLLSPEPVVVKQPQFTRVEEPTLLCNQVNSNGWFGRLPGLGIPRAAFSESHRQVKYNTAPITNTNTTNAPTKSN